jgi:hypothetical protein
MKTCFKCGLEKSLSKFYRHSAMADGHLGKCIKCTKADVAARVQRKKQDPKWMSAERERCRAKQEAYRKSGKAAPTTNATRWKWEQINQHKRRAESIATNAQKRGELIKPERCQECDRKIARLEKHHDDYSKPLQVRWLCSKCHGKTRRK